jgi:hypothetical protein
MRFDLSGNATNVGWGDDDDPATTSRSDRDRRAINLACSLLMAGIAVERQVITLVRTRTRA